MLTCKVGENIINCFDGTYDKYQLKKWSDKNILICPDCGKSYEYCHGQIVPPYFRHKEKAVSCDRIYSEPETKEHIDGKIILYNWLLNQQKNNIIQNVKLEAYIPETKQRPDLYFEYLGNRYVIEFQCTPIATEYLERHELYKLAKVNDIWILGLEKYNIKISDNDYISHNNYYKTIENHSKYYLNTGKNEIIVDKIFIMENLPYKKIYLNGFYNFGSEQFYFSNSVINIKQNAIQDLIEADIVAYNKEQQRLKLIELEESIKEESIKNSESIIFSAIELLTKYNVIQKYKIRFDIRKGNGRYYLSAVDLYSDIGELTFFIKVNNIDCCKETNGGWYKYRNVDSMDYIAINKFRIVYFIKRNIDKLVEKRIEEEAKTAKRIERENKRILKEEEKLSREKRTCITCGTVFGLSIGEVRFFKNNNLKYPRRCLSCRKLKSNKDVKNHIGKTTN